MSRPHTSEVVGQGGWSPGVMGYQESIGERCSSRETNHAMNGLDKVQYSFELCVVAKWLARMQAQSSGVTS